MPIKGLKSADEYPLIFPRIFILGPSGSGKTHLIGLIHEMTKHYASTNGVYLGDFDNGYPTLRNRKNVGDIKTKLYIDPDPDKPESWKDFCADSEEIYKNYDEYKFAFLACDSFTTVQNAMFNDIIKKMTGLIVKNRIRYGKIGMTDKSDYGVFERAVTNDFFPEFIKICDKMGAILTVHTELIAEDGQAAKIQPKVKGNALGGDTIMLYFNEAIMCKSIGTGSNTQRRIQTTSDFQVSLKSQVPGMPTDVTFEEYVFRMGVHFGFLKGGMLEKYAIDKGIDWKKLVGFKIPISNINITV
jgi:hypothetical protein